MKEGKTRRKLRFNEYYNMQSIFDELYKNSEKGYKFSNLMELISKEENILLAFRKIKDNVGGKTPGVDNKTIDNLKSLSKEQLIGLVKKKLDNYKPKPVKRTEIPKSNGKVRKLGIPCIIDRLIQQCILNVLEPICEAKFYYRSFGFRPNRSTKHAVGACMNLINFSKMKYSVDIDIEGFFDNVNHSKLIKQIWSLGIQDKKLLCIISKILKSEIENEGVPQKGTPQGGILSPLLSNIVLNELDWWIAHQWESYKTRVNYVRVRKDGTADNSELYRRLRKTNLKEMYIVRYADDFKIFTNSYNNSKKIMTATTKWLEKRLNLKVSKEKSKITNLRKTYTEFLGIKMIAKNRRGKWVCCSKMTDKSKNKVIEQINNSIKNMQREINIPKVNRFNSMILGMHNYYKMASNVSSDFSHIHYLTTRNLENRLRGKVSKNKFKSETYKRIFPNVHGNYFSFGKITLFPIYGVKTKPPMGFVRKINNYTEEGRMLIHKELMRNNGSKLAMVLMERGNEFDDVELYDNKISKIISQLGKCWVTKRNLTIDSMECHHKKPREVGGSNKFCNLVWLNKSVHKLIHATKTDTISKYMKELNLQLEEINKVNKLRKLVGNFEILTL